ncbi:hypothetical protein TNCV_960121 [Trichonephila clavipes]|nr:hypothetical protein TNCV_960121 [Trichonephila clavipes]
MACPKYSVACHRWHACHWFTIPALEAKQHMQQCVMLPIMQSINSVGNSRQLKALLGSWGLRAATRHPRGMVSITSIAIDRWTAEVFWIERLKTFAVSNYKRKYSRLAEVCSLYKSSTDYNKEN